MTFDTINDAQTVAGNGEGTILAGRYRIVRQLGQGGMGSVWLVEDTQLDNKQFAIKMLPAILVANKRAYRQLKDEALVAMRLVHPNIVQIRAFEENNGNPFLVMDYIDGQTLDDYLADKGKLSEDEVIRVLRPIAAALDYAHGEGVVHRDVKPANVMIRKDGHPFILDFGIAREIQETMTRVTGKLSSGTLLYMSPEQLHGAQPKKEQDIYSFAAMAYECLKGEPPFSRGQIDFQILNEEPEFLVGRAALSAPLAASIMAGLAKKPEDRPRNCAAVLEGDEVVSRRGAEAQRNLNSCAESSQQATPRPPGGSHVPTEEEAKRSRAETKIRMLRLKQISDDDGFAKRKSELNDAFQKADIFFESGLWAEAASRFAECSRQVENLEKLDSERKIAKERREKTAAAQSGAKNAQAGEYAAAEWENAARLLSDGDAAYGRMDFAAAIVALGDSAAGFSKSEHKAIEERKVREEAERKAREEAERKAREEAERKAREEAERKAREEAERKAREKAERKAQEEAERKAREEAERKAREEAERRSMGRARCGRVQLWKDGPYWATMNIGAEKPEDYGYYFWWGDTVGYKRVGHSWEASDGSASNFSFKNTNMFSKIFGKQDNVPTYGKDLSALRRDGWITATGALAPEHDAAHVKWGGDWRMPTDQELADLCEKCDWSWVQMNGVNGYVVRGRGDYASFSIFLPCTGYGSGASFRNAGSLGLYWSSVPTSGNGYLAWDLYFDSGGHYTGNYYRDCGQSVRPVQGFTR